MANSSIILAGQVLHGRDHLGDWRVNKLDGYFESPGVRSSSADRVNDDGEHDVPVNNTARFITMSGRVLCSGPAQVRHAANRLTGLLRSKTETLQVTDADGTTWARVKRNGPTTPVKVNDRMLRFQFDIKAPDSHRFGKVHIEELTGGQSRSLYHYGNTEAAPLVEIRGPITGGYQINSNDGRVFRVNSGIASGARHTIDMNDGLLRVNGRVQAGLVGQADVWKIPPGLLPSGGTLNMALRPDVASQTPVGSVYITDTYI